MAAFRGAERLKVEFFTGPKGNITKLIKKDEDIIGALTANGTTHLADTTILAAGTQALNLLDMKDQLRPIVWTLAHIKTSLAACKLCKNLPVLFTMESVFFMEPDAEKHELKICDEHPG
jgi:sarcosine oxidase/L-pipecolate oxidase